MISKPGPLEFLHQAQEGVRLAARFLEYPNAAGIEQARQCLLVVIGQLQACQAMAGSAAAAPEFRAAAQAAAGEMAHADAMLREAGRLFGGWKRVLSTRLGGYTRQGSPAQLRCRQHVTVRI